MHKPRILAALAAAPLALVACHPETVTFNRYDPQAAALRNAPPVAPPPSIVASRTYRCSPGNSLVYVDFSSDHSANIRTSETGTPTHLTQANGQGAYTAPGYSVSDNAERIHVTMPGSADLTCHV